ncbi:MAG: A/G-specific adenine glycosylase [Deltaproteobacteria bacterium]|nr:A/G-specific adenine glycosylase [Deltaproteobacteria bacterium]
MTEHAVTADGAVFLTEKRINRFRKLINRYYGLFGRRLPWRETLDPYKIVVSEIMLQQTQVARVVAKYSVFIESFPDFTSLAAAPLKEILRRWQGLGYNRRAAALQRLASMVTTEYGGMLPDTVKELERLPGVGPATARSIAAFAFNKPVVFLETNIRSVFIHHFFQDTDVIPDRVIEPLVEATLDRTHPREWYNGLMDYGTALKRKHGNPAKKSARYNRQSPFAGSNRQMRGALVRKLAEGPPMTPGDLAVSLDIEESAVFRVLGELIGEGLVAENVGCYTIR